MTFTQFPAPELCGFGSIFTQSDLMTLLVPHCLGQVDHCGVGSGPQTAQGSRELEKRIMGEKKGGRKKGEGGITKSKM